MGSESQGAVLEEKAPVLVYNDENSEEPCKGIIVSTTMPKREAIESAIRKFRLEGDPNDFVLIEITEKGWPLIVFSFPERRRKEKKTPYRRGACCGGKPIGSEEQTRSERHQEPQVLPEQASEGR